MKVWLFFQWGQWSGPCITRSPKWLPVHWLDSHKRSFGDMLENDQRALAKIQKLWNGYHKMILLDTLRRNFSSPTEVIPLVFWTNPKAWEIKSDLWESLNSAWIWPQLNRSKANFNSQGFLWVKQRKSTVTNCFPSNITVYKLWKL